MTKPRKSAGGRVSPLAKLPALTQKDSHRRRLPRWPGGRGQRGAPPGMLSTPPACILAGSGTSKSVGRPAGTV
jgi:hypothetical protein